MQASRLFLFILILTPGLLTGQQLPAPEENIPSLVTFGKDAPPNTGDNDHLQEAYLMIPIDYEGPVYLRIFDPETGGDDDEIFGQPETCTKYTLLGGEGVFDPGNHYAGRVILSHTFCNEGDHSNRWFTMGPFTKEQGQKSTEFNTIFFKIMAEGISGDDGNLYKYFLSRSPTENLPVENARFYWWEITFRMWENPNNISHLYPAICADQAGFEVNAFDWDDDGIIRLVSVVRNGDLLDVSGDNEWTKNRIELSEDEITTSLDIQIIKEKADPVKANNVTIQLLDDQEAPLLPCKSPSFLNRK